MMSGPLWYVKRNSQETYGLMDDPIETGTKTYDVQQLDADGDVLASVKVEALSGEAAAKQLREVASGTESIAVCLGDEVMNEMGVQYWQQRVRGRR
ncbi:hypothetical protein UC8_11660 [Roseimaritima ulvae]|uniref:Uncharacterized protein n=2 Tax=Roseimaritima ulvae TaxID=980254 RepID=A0A5B9QNY5_9BACT|nr:hypothetical protein UC8_11660 [Roseimaritima ulvae]